MSSAIVGAAFQRQLKAQLKVKEEGGRGGRRERNGFRNAVLFEALGGTLVNGLSAAFHFSIGSPGGPAPTRKVVYISNDKEPDQWILDCVDKLFNERTDEPTVPAVKEACQKFGAKLKEYARNSNRYAIVATYEEGYEVADVGLMLDKGGGYELDTPKLRMRRMAFELLMHKHGRHPRVPSKIVCTARPTLPEPIGPTDDVIAAARSLCENDQETNLSELMEPLTKFVRAHYGQKVHSFLLHPIQRIDPKKTKVTLDELKAWSDRQRRTQS